MDAAEYKRLCNQPNLMRRSDIRATALILKSHHPDLAARVATLLDAPPLAKPEAHTGAPDADRLYLNLSEHDVEGIVDVLGDHEASLAEAGSDATQVSFGSELLDLWLRADKSRRA